MQHGVGDSEGKHFLKHTLGGSYNEVQQLLYRASSYMFASMLMRYLVIHVY